MCVVYDFVCVLMSVYPRLSVFVCASMCMHLCTNLWKLLGFFLCAERVLRAYPDIYILSHALFEVKMWQPAAIKRRQQLGNKGAGGVALGRLPCFRVGLYFSGEVHPGCSAQRTGEDGTEIRGERERLRDERRRG